MQEQTHTSPFDGIRRVNEQGGEYWLARELYKLLGYSRWEKFQKSIEEAKIACENSGQAVADHFHLEVKVIKAGKGATRTTEDYHPPRAARALAPVRLLSSGYKAVELLLYPPTACHALSTSPTLHACAKHPAGVKGGSGSATSQIEPTQLSHK